MLWIEFLNKISMNFSLERVSPACISDARGADKYGYVSSLGLTLCSDDNGFRGESETEEVLFSIQCLIPQTVTAYFNVRFKVLKEVTMKLSECDAVQFSRQVPM
jgi:hypothetical protein